jgi:hypothetical protein
MNISAEHREILEQFCDRAKNLSECSVFRKNKSNISLTVKFTRGKGIRYKEIAPPEEDLINLITLLRPFYLQKETINFLRVSNIVLKYLDSKGQIIKDKAISIRENFIKTCKDLPIGIDHDGKKLTATEIIDLYFNARIFHADPKKTKRFNELLQSPVGPVIQFTFKSAVRDLSILVIQFGSLIESQLLLLKGQFEL